MPTAATMARAYDQAAAAAHYFAAEAQDNGQLVRPYLLAIAAARNQAGILHGLAIRDAVAALELADSGAV